MDKMCSNWTSEEDKVLINFVRNHEIIYNVKSKDYRKTHLKQNLWREIGDVLDKTDSDCSKRWCYVRDYYVRRKAKPGTGASGEAARKRASLLSFLDDLPTTRRGSIHITDENPENTVKIEDTDSERAQTPEEDMMENTSNSEDTQPNSQEIIFEFEKSDRQDDRAINNRRKHDAHSQSTQDEIDENDLFFGSMAKIVKKLPPYEQVQLRLQIGSLVGNAQLRQISNDSHQADPLETQHKQ
ncbi:uncharacterized protein LOC121728349 [Aricia agestis]|uniref:uncharacterized protein LOC121728349 n=1 Tax=Aricia agestis TaxID=91739 RepID=UPI001C20A1CF|nr:uncharacterized protein LOC121728349 [Aricia agestis]